MACRASKYTKERKKEKYNCYKGLAVISCFELVGGAI